MIKNTNTDATDPRLILSYGMGVDSTAILLRWMAEPETCPCDLKDLVVITSMVGDEFETTRVLLEKHILPRLREHGIRFIQVARGGLKEEAGAIILSDTSAPTELFFDGVYKLSDEMRAAATIPTTGGTRKCSLKYKGWVIDGILNNELQGAPFIHVIGFNAEEGRRIAKDQVYGAGGNRTASYPLMDWGWDRAKCEEYIEEQVGAAWRKSACSFCPFSSGCGEVVERFVAEPEGAALAMEIEQVALTFNPRMKLYKTKTVRSVIEAAGVTKALQLLDDRLDATEWALYRLRRAMLPKDGRSKDQKKKTHADYVAGPIWNHEKRGASQRSIERISDPMTKAKAEALMATHGDVEAGRVTVRDSGEGFPRVEEYLVAAPVYVQTKHGRWGREKFDAHLAKAEMLLEKDAG